MSLSQDQYRQSDIVESDKMKDENKFTFLPNKYATNLHCLIGQNLTYADFAQDILKPRHCNLGADVIATLFPSFRPCYDQVHLFFFFFFCMALEDSGSLKIAVLGITV